MAAVLDGACLMNVHMAGSGADHSLTGIQHRVNHDGVGLRAAGQQIYICLRTLAGRPDLFHGADAIMVCAVSWQLLHIGLHQPPQHLGMSPFCIVACK